MTDKTNLDAEPVRLLPQSVRGAAYFSIAALLNVARGIQLQAKQLRDAAVAWEAGNDTPEISAAIAQGVATVFDLGEDIVLPVSDGTFTITRADGTPEPVEYPLTIAGLENAYAEKAEGDDLGFKPGPNGPRATAVADAEREFNERIAAAIANAQINKAGAAFGEALSKALN